MALTGWLKAALNLSQASGSKKKGKSTLADEQRDLAVKLKDSFMALENELAEISGLIQSAEDGDFQAADKIRSRQAHLRNLATRVKAGFMRSTDLDRESSEWRSLLSSGDIDPAQLAKLEILASELALRTTRRTSNVERRTTEEAPTELSPPQRDPATYTSMEAGRATNYPPGQSPLGGGELREEDSEEGRVKSEDDQVMIVDEDVDEGVQAVVLAMDQATHGNESANHLEIDPENLLLGIRQTSDELTKCKYSHASNEEFVQTLRELKTLHAALKSMDRKNGYCRDRIAATKGFERLF